MSDWKERLKLEYAQTKERYEKLKAYNIKKQLETYLRKDDEPQEDICNRALLQRQQSAMEEYLHILELRAELANITL